MRPHIATDTPLAPRLPARPSERPRAPFSVVSREVELVVNANASGNGAADEVVARATRALRAAGARVSARLTANEQELAAAVRAAQDRRIVLVGGDGTVHALANLDRQVLPPTALLPAGRANNIARALGIPIDWHAAARLAVRGRATGVDALHVVTPARSLYAVEGVSAGFHAAARHRYDGKNSGDLVAGMRALADQLREFRPGRITLRVDGVTMFDGQAAQLFLANLPFFGFGFHVDPVADPSDGRLEAIVLEAETRRDVVRMLAAAHRGRHLGRPGVTWSAATRAHVEQPVPLVADAQPLGVTTAVVTVAPKRLRLVAPEPRS
jgi:diacylglycerol kinase family enzyme